MRQTIGKEYIKLVKKTARECLKQKTGKKNIIERVKLRLPLEIWDTWYGADSEISWIIIEEREK